MFSLGRKGKDNEVQGFKLGFLIIQLKGLNIVMMMKANFIAKTGDYVAWETAEFCSC